VPDELIAVRTFGSHPEAQVALAALETADVDAVLQAETFGGHSPEVAGVTGGIALLVRASELARAREILDSAPGAPDETVASSCAECGRMLSHASAVCPDCNDEDDRDIVLSPKRGRFAIAKLKLAIVLFFSALMVAPEIFGWITGRLNGFDITAPMLYMTAGGAGLLVLVLFVVRRSDERL
jgi:hypothetical protein